MLFHRFLSISGLFEIFIFFFLSFDKFFLAILHVFLLIFRKFDFPTDLYIVRAGRFATSIASSAERDMVL